MLDEISCVCVCRFGCISFSSFCSNSCGQNTILLRINFKMGQIIVLLPHEIAFSLSTPDIFPNIIIQILCKNTKIVHTLKEIRWQSAENTKPRSIAIWHLHYFNFIDFHSKRHLLPKVAQPNVNQAIVHKSTQFRMHSTNQICSIFHTIESNACQECFLHMEWFDMV